MNWYWRIAIICCTTGFLNSCKPVNSNSCLKNEIIGSRFRVVAPAIVVSNGYFDVYDSAHIEFQDDQVSARSKLVWLNCDSYFIVPYFTTYSGGAIQVGDTLHVNWKRAENDTFLCRATGAGETFDFKLIKLK